MEIQTSCRYSEPRVFPSNWKSKKANISKPWYITYRFYGADGQIKQVSVRGMNRSNNWKDRKFDTEVILKALVDDLEKGYNPITNNNVDDLSKNAYPLIGADSPLIEALIFALNSAKERITPSVYKDIKIVLNYIKNYIDVSNFRVGQITRKHVIGILNKVGEHKKIYSDNKKWTNNNYNHFRKYLGIAFGELVQQEIIVSNPINKDLKKLPTIKKIRLTLSPDERKTVRLFLQRNYPTFYRFTQIFFHSGARTTELLKVQGKHVDLKAQEFKVVILKGAIWQEVKKTIKDVALPFWKEALVDCSDEEYVFSKDLLPGVKPIASAQISRRWNNHIKRKLKVEADFYSLKHLHTDEIANTLSLNEARKHNNQTSNKTTEIYAVGEKERTNKKIKEIYNPF